MSIISGKELEQGSSIDPIHKENEKWYFWDESQADRHGPYDTEEIARIKLHEYCELVLGDGGYQNED